VQLHESYSWKQQEKQQQQHTASDGGGGAWWLHCSRDRALCAIALCKTRCSQSPSRFCRSVSSAPPRPQTAVSLFEE
jgi:hypothetical protein